MPLGYPDEVGVGENERFPSPPELGERSQKRREHSLIGKGERPLDGKSEYRRGNGMSFKVKLSVFKLFWSLKGVKGERVEFHQVR